MRAHSNRIFLHWLGPDVLTFAEHQCDAILPYSGGYSETTFSQGKDRLSAGYRIWSGDRNWETYRWLVPGAQVTARFYQVEGTIPEDFEPVERYYFRNFISPLMPVSEFKRLPVVAEIQPEYLTREGAWRKR